MSCAAWRLYAVLCLCAWGAGACRSGRRRRSPDGADGRCSYTFLVPETRITGPICASSAAAEPDGDRVTRMDVADVREALSRQRREMDVLQMLVDVDGDLVKEAKLLRKESRNMNSRVTQLYMQLLHEIIRKRDNSLELAQLESRVLNVTAEMLRLAARYKETELRFSALAGLVNNQSVLIAALEDRCLRTYGRQELPEMPPLVQVVPEHLPVNSRFTNEIQRDHNRAFPRGSRKDSAPTASPLGFPPPPQGTLSSDGKTPGIRVAVPHTAATERRPVHPSPVLASRGARFLLKQKNGHRIPGMCHKFQCARPIVSSLEH